MFRASRQLQRLAPRAPRVTSTSNSGFARPSLLLQQQSPLRALSHPRQSPILALQTASFASKTDADVEAQHKKKVIEDALKPRPEEVSTTSSTRKTLETPGTPGVDGNLTGGLKHDIGVVQDTFSLGKVPREPQALGLFGTVPYLATSVSTLFLAWDLTKELPTGNSFYDIIFVNHETAHYLLSVIEPIQLGYGAVIISFLGAIHWGLEYAEKTPLKARTNFRYGVGVTASIVAWPTMFMPLEYALTTQFMGFVALYFADARATTLGWAPAWYSNYRFLLTVIVGIAIFLSLVGRAKISQEGRLTTQGISSSLSKTGIADHKTDWAKLEAEEKEKLKKEKEEAEKKAKEEAAAKKKADKESGKKGKKSEGKGKKESKDEVKDKKKDDDEDEGESEDEDNDKSKDEDSKDEGKDDDNEDEGKDDDSKDSKDGGEDKEDKEDGDEKKGQEKK